MPPFCHHKIILRIRMQYSNKTIRLQVNRHWISKPFQFKNLCLNTFLYLLHILPKHYGLLMCQTKSSHRYLPRYNNMHRINTLPIIVWCTQVVGCKVRDLFWSKLVLFGFVSDILSERKTNRFYLKTWQVSKRR